MRGASSWSPDSVESDAVSDSTSDSKAVSDSTSDSDERGREGRLRLRVPRGGDRRAGRRAFTQGAKAPGEMSAIQKTSRRTTVAFPPPPRRAGSGPRNGRRRSPRRAGSGPRNGRRRSPRRGRSSCGKARTRVSPLLRPRVPPPPPPRPPSSAPASPLLRPRVPPPPPTQGAYPCKKADRWVSVVGGPRGASPVFRGWGGWVFPRVPFRCDPDPEPGRRDADAVRSDGPLRVPLPVRVLRSRSRRSWPAPSAGVGRAGPLCAPERPAPRRPGPPPGPARSRARRQCSHFALIIYIYWDEVRTLRVLTSFTRRPRPLGAVPPAGQWGAARRAALGPPAVPLVPASGGRDRGARGRPTGARGSYLITAEPGSRGPGPAPCPFLVSMRNGSGNRRIGR
uniref:Uncharacterized protein n=1 Tax=Human herpesvirus 1 TaxID=10298 RepID=A0A2U9A8P6_HHV1|nr:hypothetical protein [Human alphaherpesvirus 1]